MASVGSHSTEGVKKEGKKESLRGPDCQSLMISHEAHFLNNNSDLYFAFKFHISALLYYDSYTANKVTSDRKN
jgi:hypothetical protein